MRSCVQQKHTLRLKQICAPSEFMGSRGFGLPGRKSWEVEGKSLSCRHKGRWWELAVSMACMAIAGGVLSKWTKCWTVLSHTEVSHGSKDLSDCYGKECPPSQPMQSFKMWNGDEHEMNMKWTCHPLSVFQNTKNKPCPSLSLASESGKRWNISWVTVEVKPIVCYNELNQMGN